jgi:hypothetical protein
MVSKVADIALARATRITDNLYLKVYINQKPTLQRVGFACMVI